MAPPYVKEMTPGQENKEELQQEDNQVEQQEKEQAAEKAQKLFKKWKENTDPKKVKDFLICLKTPILLLEEQHEEQYEEQKTEEN